MCFDERAFIRMPIVDGHGKAKKMLGGAGFVSEVEVYMKIGHGKKLIQFSK